METFNLSTSQLEFEFQAADQLRMHRFGSGGFSWLNPDSPSGLFALYISGEKWDAHNLTFRGWTMDAEAGLQHAIAVFAGQDFEVEYHILVYENTTLIEQWQVIRATIDNLSITRLDSYALDIPKADYQLLYFDSDWGQEFESARIPLQAEVILETRTGRSSKGQHPWFALFAGDDQVLSGSVAWSGNWICRFETLADGGCRLSGGLHDWNFSKTLLAGESLESPHVILALGHDLNHVSRQYARVGRQHWYPRNALSAALPVEWNHWWSYEDVDINESVFRTNVEAAAKLGVEICTLDAGWFGAGSEWHTQRGDWHLVNRERFPSGIRALADFVHAKGMKFGLWCEIEGLGAQAELATLHPDFPALRDGQPLGYVCFGNPAVQEWAYQILSGFFRDYAPDWLKLDFNVDPEAGCNRVDQGHKADDGLYEHYQGYYRVLSRIRADFPDVVLENCSSGGLRIDLGMMRQTHLTFLSDPDWPVHDLQVFWGASTLLAPDACLHWSFSEWRGEGRPPQQNFNPRDPNLQPHQLDYYTRMALLGAFGLSQKLPELPAWVAERFAYHIWIYKSVVRRFVREANLYRLTNQPRRNGEGERWCAFQYSLPDNSEHLLFVFRLPNSEPERAIQLASLDANRLYQIQTLDGESLPAMTGRDLMESGLIFSTLREEDSALLRLF
ncbi:MAG: alpha-galactosidase [Chloroflexota bacterium]